MTKSSLVSNLEKKKGERRRLCFMSELVLLSLNLQLSETGEVHISIIVDVSGIIKPGSRACKHYLTTI